MSTKQLVLTNTPQAVSTKPCYIQAFGGQFKFVFSDTTPTNKSVYFQDTKIYSDGSLGALWAWSDFQSVTISVAENVATGG